MKNNLKIEKQRLSFLINETILIATMLSVLHWISFLTIYRFLLFTSLAIQLIVILISIYISFALKSKIKLINRIPEDKMIEKPVALVGEIKSSRGLKSVSRATRVYPVQLGGFQKASEPEVFLSNQIEGLTEKLLDKGVGFRIETDGSLFVEASAPPPSQIKSQTAKPGKKSKKN